MNRAKMHAEIARAIHEIKNNNYDGQPITRIKDVIDSYVASEIERVTLVTPEVYNKGWVNALTAGEAMQFERLCKHITLALRERAKGE